MEGLKKGPKEKIPLDLLRATLKKVPNWKTPGHDGIHVHRFKNSLPSMTDRLTK